MQRHRFELGFAFGVFCSRSRRNRSCCSNSARIALWSEGGRSLPLIIQPEPVARLSARAGAEKYKLSNPTIAISSIVRIRPPKLVFVNMPAFMDGIAVAVNVIIPGWKRAARSFGIDDMAKLSI